MVEEAGWMTETGMLVVAGVLSVVVIGFLSYVVVKAERD